MRGLENAMNFYHLIRDVHHHMRGLEKITTLMVLAMAVHHHMRGLENGRLHRLCGVWRSPPHAWLRNANNIVYGFIGCSPPHAWLRNE